MNSHKTWEPALNPEDLARFFVVRPTTARRHVAVGHRSAGHRQGDPVMSIA